VQIRILRLANVLLLALSFGCATSGGGSDVRAPLAAGTDLTSFRALALEVAPNSGVTLPAGSADRIRMEVAERVARKAPGRFTDGPDAVPALEAGLTITRYDEGNAFLRFLLAGLGAAHIDGVLRLESGGATLAEYDVNKTFAWGGIYGGATEMSEIEQGFAERAPALIVGAE
jgi:Domain of unknown function (DUF4410)